MAVYSWFVFRLDPRICWTGVRRGNDFLGAAPCTAMVFVWSRLSNGDPNYTLVQVAINDLIMLFAFAPIAAIFLGVSDVLVPWETMITAVCLFVLLPLILGCFVRLYLRSSRRISGWSTSSSLCRCCL